MANVYPRRKSFDKLEFGFNKIVVGKETPIQCGINYAKYHKSVLDNTL